MVTKIKNLVSREDYITAYSYNKDGETIVKIGPQNGFKSIGLILRELKRCGTAGTGWKYKANTFMVKNKTKGWACIYKANANLTKLNQLWTSLN